MSCSICIANTKPLAASFHGPDSPPMDPAGIVETLRTCARDAKALCSIACTNRGMYEERSRKTSRHVELGLRQCAEAELQELCDSDVLIDAVKLLRTFSFALRCRPDDAAMIVARYGQRFEQAAAEMRAEIERGAAKRRSCWRDDLEDQMMFEMDM